MGIERLLIFTIYDQSKGSERGIREGHDGGGREGG